MENGRRARDERDSMLVGGREGEGRVEVDGEGGGGGGV